MIEIHNIGIGVGIEFQQLQHTANYITSWCHLIVGSHVDIEVVWVCRCRVYLFLFVCLFVCLFRFGCYRVVWF